MIKLDINTNAIKEYADTLGKMHKSALPLAVRGALNKAAFDVKTNTMPASANAAFANRSPNFFKANSRVEIAKGFEIRSMQATVGFTEKDLKGNNNYAVKDLEQQEYGGNIEGRSFIPTEIARGNNKMKLVRPANRITKVLKILDAKRNMRGRNSKEKFVRSVYSAGKGGFVIGEYKGKEMLWRVNSLRKSADGKFKLSAMFYFKKQRSIHVKPTAFMRQASMKSAARIEEFFIVEARRQFNKLK
jgi:hypothetical protein